MKLFLSPVSHLRKVVRWQPSFPCFARRTSLLMTVCLLVTPLLQAQAIGEERYVEFARHADDFSIVSRGIAAILYVDSKDFPGVVRAAGDLQADIARVTSLSAVVAHD